MPQYNEELRRDIEIILTPLEDADADGRDFIAVYEKLGRLIDRLLTSQQQALKEKILSVIGSTVEAYHHENEKIERTIAHEIYELVSQVFNQ